MLATAVAKIQERSPLKYNFARKLASLDPMVMVSNLDGKQRMQTLCHLDKFSSFKITTDRLDSFVFELLQNQSESQQLWITMQLILTLSHGQAR